MRLLFEKMCDIYGVFYLEVEGMIEIRFHGRGGQGAVTAAEILALAAFLEGKEAQHFPEFGAERRGAPVKAYCRISEKPIIIHSGIYNPDCVVVFDASLLKAGNATAGLKKDGWLILNSSQGPENFEYLGFSKVASVDATSIALLNKLGSEKAPIVNTTILGALIRATEIVHLQSVVDAITRKIEQKKDINAIACGEAVLKTKIHIFGEISGRKGGDENVQPD